jgi:CRP/FNR family transcriptional regulator
MRPSARHRRQNNGTIPPHLSALCQSCQHCDRCAFAFLDAAQGANATVSPPPVVVTRTYRTGSYIVREGEPVSYLVVVCRGLVVTTMITENGDSLAFETKGMSGILGLSDWLLRHSTFTVSVQALADTTVAFVKPQALLSRVMKPGGPYLNTFFEQVGTQIQTLQDRFCHQTIQPALGRVAHDLLQFVKQLGILTRNNVVLPVKANRQLLAQLNGLTRETVSRIFSELSRRRLIRWAGRRLVIPDIGKLEQILRAEARQLSP